MKTTAQPTTQAGCITGADDSRKYSDSIRLDGGVCLTADWDGDWRGQQLMNVTAQVPGCTSHTAYRGLTVEAWLWLREALVVWGRGGYPGEVIEKLVCLRAYFPDRSAAAPVTDDEYEFVVQEGLWASYRDWAHKEPNRGHVTDDACNGRDNAKARMDRAKARIMAL